MQDRMQEMEQVTKTLFNYVTLCNRQQQIRVARSNIRSPARKVSFVKKKTNKKNNVVGH